MHKSLENLPKNARVKLKETALPNWIAPMLATLTHDHFSDPNWVFKRKLDGQRCLFFKEGNDLRLMSRNQKKQNSYYLEIMKAVESLPGNFILDGELVTFDDKVTSFSALQNRMHVQNPDDKLLKAHPVYAYLFDLIYLDGYDLTHLDLKNRKRVLESAFDFKDPLVYLAHKDEESEDYLNDACEHGWEGLIAKDGNSTYVHSRSAKWLKFKCDKSQEFVIGGYTAPEGERIGFGALLIGFYRKEKSFMQAKWAPAMTTNFWKNSMNV